jgi:HAD superfamily hydrolase (TIGR01509 family)
MLRDPMSQGPKERAAAPAGIDAVIFDMDGVLTDSEPLICAAAISMFAEQGLRVAAEDFRPFVGTGEDRYIGGVARKYHCKLDLASAKRRIYEIYLEMVPTRLAAFPGAQDLVKRCRQAGLRVALASSADEIKIVANLRQINLPEENWDAVVSGEVAKAKKPAPDLFLAAAARLGVRPEQCVVVEDAVNGVVAAKAAGMRCVGVAQTFTARELAGADLVRQKIAEVTLADLLGPRLGKGTALRRVEEAGSYPEPAPE